MNRSAFNVVRIALLCLILAVRTPMTLAEVPVASTQVALDPVDVLRNVMQHEERFVKVHAAEALIELRATDGVKDIFIAQEHEHHETQMYRLGVWRVLARLSAGTPEQEQWVDRLRTIALGEPSPERIAAIESLAKIKYSLKPQERPVIEKIADSNEEGIALFSMWLLSQAAGSANPQDRVARYLDSKDPITRLRAIYILRFLPDLTAENRAKIRTTARAEPKGTLTFAYATSSSFIVARMYGDREEASRMRDALHGILQSGQPGEKQEACRALGEQGTRGDIDAMRALLEDPAAAARVGAGLAIAKLSKP